MLSTHQNRILSVFKNLGYSETSQLTNSDINKTMQKLIDSNISISKLDMDFTDQMLEELWQNTSQMIGGKKKLKDYIVSITEALNELQGHINSTIGKLLYKKGKIQSGISYEDKDDLEEQLFSYVNDHNILTGIFNLPNIKQNKKVEKYYNLKKFGPDQMFISTIIQQFDFLSPVKRKDQVNRLVKLGVECAGKKEYQEAIFHWKKALQMDKDSYLHYANISRIIGVIGRYKEAIQYGQKAIKLNPQYPYAHLNLALGYAGQKRFEQALKHSQIALDLSPKDPLCYIDRADILTQAGKQEEADKFYDLANKLNNSSSEIKFNQDHINETLQRKFKKLNKYIDNLEGNKNQKKQLKENVESLYNDMLKSKRSIKASQIIQKEEVKQDKQKKSQINQLEQRLSGLQQKFIQMADMINKDNETQEIMLMGGKKNEDQIEKINRQVKQLRAEMKELKQFVKQTKTPTTSPQKQKKQSFSQSARIHGQDLEDINAQLADITESTTALKIKIKKTNSEIKKASIDLFCKFIGKLNKLQSLELFVRNHHEQFLNKLKNPLLKIQSLTMIKIVSESGSQKLLKNFKEQIVLKKKSVSCETAINEWQ